MSEPRTMTYKVSPSIYCFFVEVQQCHFNHIIDYYQHTGEV